MSPDPWFHLARPDGWDFFTGYTINYRDALGSVVTCPDYTRAHSCGGGIHVTQRPNACNVGASFPCSAYLVEPVVGLVRIDATKSKARAIRVVAEITDLDTFFGWDYTGLCAFLPTIPQIRWLQPDGDPDPTWHLTRRATWREAWAASGAAAGSPGTTWRKAWASVEGAGREAMCAAAVCAARTAAWVAVRGVGVDAAGGSWNVRGAAGYAAAGMALRYPCAGLPRPTAHVEPLLAQWTVWQKGYALYGEVHGILHVYAQKGTV